MTTISQENLLGYVNGNKLGHDNSQMSNTFLSYYKNNWYGHEYRQPPTPPTPTTIIMDFNNISPYLAEPIPTITLSSENTNTLIVDSSTYTIRVFVNGVQQYTVDPELVDEWCSIYDWISPDGTLMTVDASIPITDSGIYTPLIDRQVIHRDTQGPCPDGYHIGTKSEWDAVVTALTSLGILNESDTMTYLKIPTAYYLNRSNGSKNTSYGKVRFWTSTMTNNTTAPAFIIDENHIVQVKDDKPGNAFSIRPLKDSAAIPDLNWTVLYQGIGGAGVYWNQSEGLISISGNGTDCITMKDRNLGATNVGDDGLYYQFGNNNGFTVSPSNYRTSKVSNTQGYGPGNYYNNSQYVRVSSGNGWFTDTNNNIWGGVTNGTWIDL